MNASTFTQVASSVFKISIIFIKKGVEDVLLVLFVLDLHVILSRKEIISSEETQEHEIIHESHRIVFQMSDLFVSKHSLEII